jgi:hypothetical protein
MENLKLIRKVRKVARQTQREKEHDPTETLHSYYYAINRDIDDLDINGFSSTHGEGKNQKHTLNIVIKLSVIENSSLLLRLFQFIIR